MLRITNTTREGTAWLTLEGNLAGPWVEECRCACERETARGLELALDLTDVRFVDAEGVRVLRQMAAAGVVRRSSSFVAELLRTERSQ